MNKKIFIIILTGVFFIAIRCLVSQIIYTKNGNNFLKKHQKIRAVDAYSLCIKSYMPLSPFNKICKSKIYKLYDNLIDDWEKLYALEMLRSSLISINSVFMQNKKEIYDLSIKLAKLKTKIENGDETFLKQQIKIHTIDEAPNIYLKSLVSIFFIMWLGLTFFYIFYQKFYYLIFSFISFALWILFLKIV